MASPARSNESQRLPASPVASHPGRDPGAPAGLSPDQARDLAHQLPDGAVSPHPSKNYPSTINAAFVIERLNAVFGVGAWHHQIIEHWRDGKFALVRTALHCPGCEPIEAFGGNDNADPGDAYKGAVTDAFTKAASYLGVGLYVWKERKAQQPAPQQRTEPKPQSSGGWKPGEAKYDGDCVLCGNPYIAGESVMWRQVGERKYERAHPECVKEAE